MQMNIASVIADESQAQSHTSNENRARTRGRPVEPRVLAPAASLVLLPAAGVEREEMTVLARKQHRHHVTTCL